MEGLEKNLSEVTDELQAHRLVVISAVGKNDLKTRKKLVRNISRGFPDTHLTSTLAQFVAHITTEESRRSEHCRDDSVEAGPTASSLFHRCLICCLQWANWRRLCGIVGLGAETNDTEEAGVLFFEGERKRDTLEKFHS